MQLAAAATELARGVVRDDDLRRRVCEGGQLAAHTTVLASLVAALRVNYTDTEAQQRGADAQQQPGLALSHFHVLQHVVAVALLLRNCCEEPAAAPLFLNALPALLAFLEWERRTDEGGDEWNA
jgi:hypothetical protein